MKSFGICFLHLIFKIIIVVLKPDKHVSEVIHISQNATYACQAQIKINILNLYCKLYNVHVFLYKQFV